MKIERDIYAGNELQQSTIDVLRLIPGGKRSDDGSLTFVVISALPEWANAQQVLITFSPREIDMISTAS